MLKTESFATRKAQRGLATPVLVGLVVLAAIAALGVTALLTNIFERKQEAKVTTTRLVEVTQDTTDPAR